MRHDVAVRAQVIVLAGPSGSGKSRLCDRLGLPFVNLDDFYKDGQDPTIPRVTLAGGQEIPDWDHPGSWLREEAVDTLERLCRDGVADVPVYEIALDGRSGRREVRLGGSPFFVAEGIFAQEVVGDCRARGLLADAICVTNHPMVTLSGPAERAKSPSSHSECASPGVPPSRDPAVPPPGDASRR